MKKYILLIAAAAILTFPMYAQDWKPVLQQTVTDFMKHESQSEKISFSNKLDRIAEKYKDAWAAAYYAGLSKIMLSYNEPEKERKDAYLDQAGSWIEKADALTPTTDSKRLSEMFTIKAMAANARIGVDPQHRWQKYGKLFEENLEAAKEKNEDNPRIYFLKGTSLFYTPKAFGGGKKKAAVYFEKAKALFDQEPDEDIVAPYWGAEANAFFLEQCEQENDAK